MDIQLTNTLTRTKEPFVPIKEGAVSIYSCGPTVYNTASIGNFRAFLFADVLRRMFEMNGYAVKQVMNITDVGHLTDDGSDGDDKVEKMAREEGKTAWDIAKEYTDLYLRDMDRLQILRPHVMPKATEHIDAQIAMVQKLEENGYTYKTSDGIYFDTSKLEDYGKLSGQKLEEKAEGARVAVNEEKRNATDFALWKFSYENGAESPSAGSGHMPKRHMEWESPWGVGFPGWHIECSAMSEQYLGAPFDIHTGGIDHIPVHHTNEIAQAQGALGNDLANIWMHNEFVRIDGGKMSKSLKNVYTVDDIIAKGFDPLAFRYFVLGAHYRMPINFTWEAVEAAQNALNNVLDAVWENVAAPTVPDETYVLRFQEHVNNDLDTAGALAVVWDLVKNTEVDRGTKLATLFAFDQVLGLDVDGELRRAQDAVEVPAVQELLAERLQARQEKDFAASDALRDALREEHNLIVEDRPEGQVLRPVRR